jgi:hypothetical protein
MARKVRTARVGTKRSFGRAHSASVSLGIRRQKHATKSGNAFEACASYGKHMACETARNPRVGAAKALRKLASQLSKRSGALAGFAGL